MKVWVMVDMKKAILAGKNEEGWKLVEVGMEKLSQGEREYVASRENNEHDSRCAQEIGGSVAEATEEAVVQCIREQVVVLRDTLEKKRRETEEKINSILLKKAVDYLYEDYTTYKNKNLKGWSYPEYFFEIDGRKSSDHRVIQLLENVKKECEARNEEIYQDLVKKEAEKKAKEEVEKAEKLRKEKAKEEQIKKWVEENGTWNQKKRYENYLLPESEVVDAIRDEAYNSLNDFHRYEETKASDVCTCEEGCAIDYYEVKKATEVSAEEFEAFEKIAKAAKKAHPEAIVTIMDHISTSTDCGNTVVVKSVRVEVEIGVIKFSREYVM